MKDNNNKRSVIIVVVILIALLLLFALIRGCDKKEEPKKKQKTNNDITDIVTDETSLEEEKNYYNETTTPKATPVVKKVEKKEQILTLSLVGEDIVYVDYGTAYTEEGANAFDTIDGTITQNVEKKIYLITINEETKEEEKTLVEEIDTNIYKAKYEIVYTITNSNKETKSISRTVIINDVKSTEFTLIGNREVKVELGESYIEEGTTAIETINGVENTLSVTTKYFSKDPITFELTEVTSIDTNVLTSYVIEYETTDSNGMSYKLSRNVVVTDTEAPVVTIEKDTYIYNLKDEILNLEELYNVNDKDSNLVREYTITNTLTNTLVDEISLNVVGEYKVKITVSDSSNNIANPVTVNVIVREDTAPTITLSDIGWEVDLDDEEFVTFVASVNTTDDYTTEENMKLYYALTTDNENWFEIKNNKIAYTYPNDGTFRQLLVKAVDEVGNETIITTPNFS